MKKLIIICLFLITTVTNSYADQATKEAYEKIKSYLNKANAWAYLKDAQFTVERVDIDNMESLTTRGHALSIERFIPGALAYERIKLVTTKGRAIINLHSFDYKTQTTTDEVVDVKPSKLVVKIERGRGAFPYGHQMLPECVQMFALATAESSSIAVRTKINLSGGRRTSSFSGPGDHDPYRTQLSVKDVKYDETKNKLVILAGFDTDARGLVDAFCSSESSPQAE